MTPSERHILELGGARIDPRPRSMIGQSLKFASILRDKHGFTDEQLIGLVVTNDGTMILEDPLAQVATRLDVVQRIDREHPHLLRWNSDRATVEFLQHVCKAIPGAGLLSKSGAEHSITLPNGFQVATDVIAFADGNRIDIVQGAGGHPTPGGPSWIYIPPELWRSSNRYVDVTGWPIFPSDAPSSTTPATRARLGRGWFCMFRAFQEWPAEANENLSAILGEEDPDIFRVIADVEGMKHIPRDSGMPDVWRDAGMSYKDPWWRDRVRATLELIGARGKQLLITMYGGRERFRTQDDMRRYHDAFMSAADGLWAAIYGLTCANEYKVNGWEAREVQFCGRDLRSKIPAGTRLALSSPHLAHEDPNATNEMMIDSFVELYGPPSGDKFGATFADIHKMRDFTSKWSNQFSYNGLYRGLGLADSEPFGQAASAGGDVINAEKIIGDFVTADRAAWDYYMGHNAWSVWNGHMPPIWIEWLRARAGDAHANMHAERMIARMPNQIAVSNGLRTYRQSGTIKPVEPGGGTDMIPDPGEAMGELAELHRFYQAPEGLKRPEGLWKNGAPDFEGIGAWIYGVWLSARSRGKSNAWARQAWRAAIERSDEWRGKHPGVEPPTPIPQ